MKVTYGDRQAVALE